jgi:hypothetical protein
MQRHIFTAIIAATSLCLLPSANADDHGKKSGAFGMSGKSFLEKLTDKLGKDWNVESTGGKIIATKKATADVGRLDTDKVMEECREIMDDHKKVTANHTDDGTVKVSGRSHDCGSLARDINDVAKVDGVKRLEVSVICDSDKSGKKRDKSDRTDYTE